jgi:hypothetical protein
VDIKIVHGIYERIVSSGTIRSSGEESAVIRARMELNNLLYSTS